MRPVPKPSRKPKAREKRAQLNIIYNRVAKPAYLAGLAAGQLFGPKCEICRERPADQVHHRLGRDGERLLDARYYMGLCAGCHTHVHANPQESYEKGWLIRRNSLGQLTKGGEDLPAQ